MNNTLKYLLIGLIIFLIIIGLVFGIYLLIKNNIKSKDKAECSSNNQCQEEETCFKSKCVKSFKIIFSSEDQNKTQIKSNYIIGYINENNVFDRIMEGNTSEEGFTEILFPTNLTNGVFIYAWNKENYVMKQLETNDFSERIEPFNTKVKIYNKKGQVAFIPQNDIAGGTDNILDLKLITLDTIQFPIFCFEGTNGIYDVHPPVDYSICNTEYGFTDCYRERKEEDLLDKIWRWIRFKPKPNSCEVKIDGGYICKTGINELRLVQGEISYCNELSKDKKKCTLNSEKVPSRFNQETTRCYRLGNILSNNENNIKIYYSTLSPLLCRDRIKLTIVDYEQIPASYPTKTWFENDNKEDVGAEDQIFEIHPKECQDI